MATIAEVAEVEAALQALGAHLSGPFVVRLPRTAGTRDSRYAHLLSGDVQGAPADEAAEASEPAVVPRSGLTERVQSLEAQVETLQLELAEIRQRLKPG